MSNDVTNAMHPDFPRWYREVGVEENRERLQRRWNGVANLVVKMTGADVENALRLVFRAKSAAAPDAIARIRQTFKDADELFDMQGNHRELEILCGASLAVLMERGVDLAGEGALAVTTSALDGTRSAELPMQLPALAETAIGKIAERNRERPNLENGFPEVPKVSIAGAKEKLQAGFDANSVTAALEMAASSLNASFESMRKLLAAAAQRTSRYIAIQDEELEMLWWLFGERSEDLGKPFKDVPGKAQPLIFAKELAGATQFLPGPMSAKGLLARAGLKENKKITIPEAVNGCDSSWLKEVGDEKSFSPLSQPIHFAISRKLETGDETSWIAGWASGCGVAEDHAIAALTLGNLFYRERLLSRFSKG